MKSNWIVQEVEAICVRLRRNIGPSPAQICSQQSQILEAGDTFGGQPLTELNKGAAIQLKVVSH